MSIIPSGNGRMRAPMSVELFDGQAMPLVAFLGLSTGIIEGMAPLHIRTGIGCSLQGARTKSTVRHRVGLSSHRMPTRAPTRGPRPKGGRSAIGPPNLPFGIGTKAINPGGSGAGPRSINTASSASYSACSPPYQLAATHRADSDLRGSDLRGSERPGNNRHG